MSTAAVDQQISAKPYPAYKDSGLPWIDRIPAHWDVLPNRAVMKSRKDVVGKSADKHTLLSLTKRGVIPRDLDNPEGKFPASFESYQEVQPNDLVFCLFDIDETPRAVGLATSAGMITGAYNRFECLVAESAPFILYYYLSLDDGKRLKPLYTGLRKVIQQPVFLSAKMPFPPLPEQRAIVCFLNSKLAELDQFVARKLRFIELLNEQRSVIISRNVMRGIEPNVKMRPSGIEWLGDIPEHWETKRSKFLFREVDERSKTGAETHLSMSQKYGLIPSSQIDERRLVSESYAGGKVCDPGDLVLNRLKAHLGVFALASERGLVSPDYTVFRPICPMEPRYFEALYRTPACRVELRQRAKGIVQGFWRLYTDDFYDIRIPVPPLTEQTAIMAALDNELAAVDTTISRTEREIELTNEYRTALISDVVTGKIDVRGVDSGNFGVNSEPFTEDTNV